MTDSVRCTQTSPNTFSCDALIISGPEKQNGEAPAPAPGVEPKAAQPVPASEPAVSTLVSRFVSKTLIPAPPAPLVSGAALLKCASSELSIVLAMKTGRSMIMAGLEMLKAGFDTASCLALAHDEAAQHNAESTCVAQGGVVKGVEGDKTICEVRERVQ